MCVVDKLSSDITSLPLRLDLATLSEAETLAARVNTKLTVLLGQLCFTCRCSATELRHSCPDAQRILRCNAQCFAYRHSKQESSSTGQSAHHTAFSEQRHLPKTSLTQESRLQWCTTSLAEDSHAHTIYSIACRILQHTVQACSCCCHK